jgi:hypothetical protein
MQRSLARGSPVVFKRGSTTEVLYRRDLRGIIDKSGRTALVIGGVARATDAAEGDGQRLEVGRVDETQWDPSDHRE